MTKIKEIKEIITEAIKRKKTVSFTYKKDNKRVGNPHALYYYLDKKGEKSIKIDIEQIDGYSSSKKPFPSFREFNLNEVLSVEILKDKESFSTSKDYNPASQRYFNCIEKINGIIRGRNV